MKLSPTQNMTVLVTSRQAVADYRSIAAQLLSAGHVQATICAGLSEAS